MKTPLEARKYFSKIGKKGKKAQLAKYSKAIRAEWGRKGAKKRWKKLLTVGDKIPLASSPPTI